MLGKLKMFKNLTSLYLYLWLALYPLFIYMQTLIYEDHKHLPKSLLLQWHITERCNLRCRHCYQETYKSPELALEQLLEILRQFEQLVAQIRIDSGKNISAHITLTGGEPFIHNDFFRLLQQIALRKHLYSFSILSNGTFINKHTATQLALLNPSYVQLSIEGNAHTHNNIRGEGNYERTIKAVKYLINNNIRVILSFTAHAQNFTQFADVARMGRKLNVWRVWADRLIVAGSGSQLPVMSKTETLKFFEIMYNEKQKKRLGFLPYKTEIAMHRALQFLIAGGKPYRCVAGDTLITIMPNGDLLPCRRMNIKVGNVFVTPLNEIYYNNNLFKALRNIENIDSDCKGCLYLKSCRGGLRCLSYTQYGSPFIKDSGCWI